MTKETKNFIEPFIMMGCMKSEAKY